MEEGQRNGSAGRYGVLLVTLIAAYLASAVTRTHWGGAIHVTFVAAVGLLSLRNARLRPWVARLVSAYGTTIRQPPPPDEQPGRSDGPSTAGGDG